MLKGVGDFRPLFNLTFAAAPDTHTPKRQVPCEGIKREHGFKTRAAPATVSG
ncbi:hypothetical protein FHW96_001966 [Novosphingobium sp. SG751A]|nr:hypothetical protein [Novosphingobium sp. SG751A]